METKEITCKKCGYRITSGSKFCASCGEKVENEDTVPKGVCCYNCGAMLPEDSMFCTECGTNIKAVDKLTGKEDKNYVTNKNLIGQSKQSKNKMLGFLIVGVALLITIIIIAIIVIGGKQTVNESKEVINQTDSEAVVNSQGVFWLKEPKIEIETELNKIITDYYAPTGADASEKGYLIIDYKADDYTNNETGDAGTLVTAKYGPKSVINLTASLNASGEIVSIFTFYPNPGVEITNDQLMGIYSNLALTATLHDKKYAAIEKQTQLLEKILNQNPNGDQNERESKTEAVLVEGDCEYTISMSEYMFGFQIRDLSKVPKTSDDVAERESFSYTADDNNVIAAQKMFEVFLKGKEEMDYDDPSCNGSILICKEEPSEDNNNAKYSIAGRGFSPFYDSDCIDVIGDTYVFYSGREFGGAYYKIDVVEDKMFIYWSDSLDMGQYELCGQIGETEETKSREEAEKLAKEFFKRIQGTYLNEDYVGTVTIAQTEAYGFNNYASYSLEGVGITTLYDTYCTSVVNGDEYYFELYDECYRIVDSDNIMICRGPSKDDCYTICAYLEKKIKLMNIDTYSLAGRFVNEQNSNMEFSMSMYSDYVEIGDEVGNISIGYLNGLVYWEDNVNLGVMLDDGDSFNMKVYQRNGDTIIEIDGKGVYSGTYKMVEKYIS